MKAKVEVKRNARTVIMRLMLTQAERNVLEKLAYEQTGGNMSEYVRRLLFPKGANDEQRKSIAK